MSSAFKVTQWAMSVPPIYSTGGRVDDTAHHVLLVLATFADKTGKSRPGLPLLAKRAYKTPRVVADALGRLVVAGLIKEDGDHQGTAVWQLSLDITGAGLSVAEERAERRRALTAERVRKLRERRSVTQSVCVTDEPRNAHDSVTATHTTALPDSDVTQSTAFVTHLDCVTDVPRALHPQVRGGGTAMELPMNCQEDSLRSSSTRKRANDDGKTGRATSPRGTLLPNDFSVTPDMVAWARENAPDVDGRLATDSFCDYWHGRSGAGATKRDWIGTWRNWMRREQRDAVDRAARTGARRGAAGPTMHATDAAIASLIGNSPAGPPQLRALPGGAGT